MSGKENKIHTGFRLSKNNVDFIQKISDSLGLTRTNVVDMIITILRNDKTLLSELIKKQIEKQQ
jgi:biotin operon repressor